MKQACNANEYYYRRVVSSIGIAMLSFLLFMNLIMGGVQLFGMWMQRLPLSTVAYTVIYQLLYAAGYLLTFMLPVAVLKACISGYGFQYQPMKCGIRLSKWLFPIIFGGMVLIWAQAYLNASLVSIFNYSEFSSAVIWSNGDSMEGYQIVLNFIVMCLVPAFCEEFLFRGAILTNCLPFGRGNAILISALLFGLMHQNAEQILYAFAAGILLGVVYERTGSIWNCTFLHLVNNFSSTAIAVIAQQFGWRHADAAGIALEGIIAVVGLICIALLVVYLSPKKQQFRDGVFGRSVPAADDYAAYPVSAKKAFRLFLNFPMVLFLSLCALQIVTLIGWSVLYALFG